MTEGVVGRMEEWNDGVLKYWSVGKTRTTKSSDYGKGHFSIPY